MASPPFFSVVIPCYNRRALVCDAISSVLRQTFTSYEILIVDDGSTDDTRILVEGMARLDPRIIYFYQNNAERGAARNAGILQSRGKWICFLDSDDNFLPDHLSSLHSAIASGVNEKILLSRFHFGEHGQSHNEPTNFVKSGKVSLSLLLSGNPFACNFTVMNDRSSPLLFREERALSTMEDWLFLVIHCECAGIMLLESTTVVMREHDGRSVRGHRRLVDSRRAATQLLLDCLSLNESMKLLLKSHSSYFCSVHLFLLGDRWGAFKELIQFIGGPVPLKNKLLQALRIIFGPKLWFRLRALRIDH